MNEKEMTERYIYEVVKRVPQAIKEEIRMELQELIEEMCSEEGSNVETVLQKLGDPAEFAKRYRDENNYLIGPEYYDNYIWVLKLALIGIAISAVVSALVQGVFGIDNGGNIGGITNFFARFFAEFFSTAINGAYSVVGIVTIIFAIMEWKKVKVNMKPKRNWTVDELAKNAASVKSWTPGSLPPVPDKRAVISRSDSVVSIVFISIFAVLLTFAPQLFGAFRYDGNGVKSVSCIFNLAEWDTLAPILLFCLLVGMADEIIRLVTGYYCKVVMWSSIVCNAIQIVGAVILLKFMPFWNPDFAEQIREMTGVTEFARGDLLRIWGSGTFDNIILAGICVISVIETGVAVYKTLKYTKE